MVQVEPIPRILHYCWYGGPMSELGERCLESWRRTMPDFAIERWDEQRLDRTIPYVDIAYRSGRLAFVSDYMRMLALYENGGVYLDTDIEAIRSLEDLLGGPLFMGLQAPNSIGVAVLGAPRGHPLLRLVLDTLDEEARRGQLKYQPLPEVVTPLVRRLDPAATAILPEDCFYPYNPYSPVPIRRKPLQSNLSERTYCLHHWEGSWLGEASLRRLLALRLRALLRRVSPANWAVAPIEASR